MQSRVIGARPAGCPSPASAALGALFLSNHRLETHERPRERSSDTPGCASGSG